MNIETGAAAQAGAAVKRYLGLEHREPTELGTALLAIVSEYGKASLCHPEFLEGELIQRNVPAMEAYKACLMTRVVGFRELMEGSQTGGQTVLDRFVRNAVDKTGFSRRTVLELTGEFAHAAGYEAFYQEEFDKVEQAKEADVAYVIPWSVYEADLGPASAEFSRWLRTKEAISADSLARLEALSAAGVPEAQYCLGCYLLLHAPDKGSASACEQAVSLLKKSAAAGDRHAATLLGDYYYGYYANGEDRDWNKAYGYYTGYGALALEGQRRKAFVEIVNHGKFNRKLLTLCGGFLALIAASLLIPIGGALYPQGAFWAVLCALLCGGTFGAAVMHHRVKPYGDMYYLPVLMFVIWTVFMITRLTA